MACAISSFLKINKTKFRMLLVNLTCILDCWSCEGKNKIGGFLFFPFGRCCLHAVVGLSGSQQRLWLQDYFINYKPPEWESLCRMGSAIWSSTLNMIKAIIFALWLGSFKGSWPQCWTICFHSKFTCSLFCCCCCCYWAGDWTPPTLVSGPQAHALPVSYIPDPSYSFIWALEKDIIPI